MFLCHWHRYQVKGHESRCVETQTLHTAIRAYLHKELLMVIHHLFMVLVCFPVSVVSGTGGGGTGMDGHDPCAQMRTGRKGKGWANDPCSRSCK